MRYYEEAIEYVERLLREGDFIPEFVDENGEDWRRSPRLYEDYPYESARRFCKALLPLHDDVWALLPASFEMDGWRCCPVRPGVWRDLTEEDEAWLYEEVRAHTMKFRA